MAQIKVVVKEPGKPAEVKEIENDWLTFKDLIGCEIFSSVTIGAGIIMYIDDVGKLKDLPFNFRLGTSDYVVGNAVFFSNDGGEDEQSLTDNQIEYLTLCFGRDFLPCLKPNADLDLILKYLKRG
jgi:hypothetical protein